MDAIVKPIVCFILFFIPVFASAFENEESFLKNSYVVTNQSVNQYQQQQQTERIQKHNRMRAQHMRRKREKEMRRKRYQLYKQRMHERRMMEHQRREQMSHRLKGAQSQNSKMRRVLSAREQRYQQWAQENQDLRNKMAQHDQVLLNQD